MLAVYTERVSTPKFPDSREKYREFALEASSRLDCWWNPDALHWFGRLIRGDARGLSDIARAEGLSRTYVTSFIHLAFLAPDITKAILEGRQPSELTAKRLINSALKMPLLWADQALLVEQRIVFVEHAIYRFEDKKIAEVFSVLDKAAIEVQL